MTRSTIARSALFGGSALALTLFASAAIAQSATGGIDAADEGEIIVTATKRATTLQDVPFSISALTQQAIERSGSTNLEDVSRNVAGLTIQNLGPGQSQVSVRGVSAGQIVRDQPGVKEQVGVYLDESVVSLSLFTPDLDLFDLNRVETLRGPQGTLFGSGSVGGTIRYITNQPRTDKVEGQVEANINTVDENDVGGYVKGAINLPLSDKLAVRAVGYHTEYAGFIDALREGGGRDKDVNDGRRSGGRLAVAFKPSEDVTITPRVVYQEIRAHGFNRQDEFNLFANPFTTTRPAIDLPRRQQYLLLGESFKDNTLLADLTATVSFGGVSLTSVSSYIDRDIRVVRDASALTGSVSVDLGYPAAAVTLPSRLVDRTNLKTYTQELRLASDNSGPFQWLIGGFYSDIDRGYTQRLPTPGYDAFTDAVLGAGTAAATANGFPANSPYNSNIPYKIKQKAVFGEASYDVTDKLTVTAGGRYYDFKESRTFKSGGLFANGDNNRDRTKSDGFTPRFLVKYEASRDLTFNAQASKGFRLGGVNDPLNLPLCSGGATGPDAAIYGNRPTYKDETLWNYEAGVKASRGAFSFNSAVFYTDIHNLQVTADAGSCSSRVVFNVPKAHTVGIEAELSAKPFDGLDLSLSGSYVEAEFDSTLTDSAGGLIAGIRDGNRLPTVPKFQLTASATYSRPIRDGINGVFSAAYQHVGSRYTQASDQESNPRSFVSGLPFGGATGTQATVLDLKLPRYQLVNLSAGLELDSGLSITAYVNNLFDVNPKLSFDRERGGRARLGFNVGQPRVIGLTGRKKF